MTIHDLVGKKIEHVEPMCKNRDEILLALKIEGLSERVLVELDSDNFTDLSKVNFLSD